MIVFFLLQCDVGTIIKLKLKQASKEFWKEFQTEKIRERPAKKVFYVRIAILQNSLRLKGSSERFSRMKY